MCSTTFINIKGPHFRRLFFSLLLLCGLSGCASLPEAYPSDPFEPLNRDIDQFNRDLDTVFARPVAKGFRAVLPSPVDRGVSNFFANIDDINSAINNLLQLKPKRAVSDVGRICLNTTIGMLGLFDVASDVGLENYKEDLGQTLGYWGVGDKPFLTVPMTGPNTLRDLIGQIGDLMMNPVYYTSQGVYWSLLILRFVDTRADLLETTDVLEEAAVDPYAFVRETYLQIRKSKIHDGEPPIDDLLFEDEEVEFED